MILIADKVQDFKCVLRMYEIVFIKKQKMFQEWYLKNFLYNLHFFLQHLTSDNTQFIPLANQYIRFLYDNGVNLQNYDFLQNKEYRNAGINLGYIFIKEVIDKPSIFSKEMCADSKNILIYTGFSDKKWNYSYMLENALGGSEKAVAYLSQCLPKDYTIYVSGDVLSETIDCNIHYVPLEYLENIIKNIPFHTVIVSRYISFYEMFPQCSFYKSFIWAHDTHLLPYGCELKDKQILQKWNKYIDGCICLTEWHKRLYISNYSELNNKIHIINNGIDIDSFNKNVNIKIKNRFIYSSRPERGLKKLLQLWPKILEQIPDATLGVACYGNFPSNPNDEEIKLLMDKYESVQFLGKLKVDELYSQMSFAEFWLYPTDWPETSCITALEMLMSEVICIYYPFAGLTNTMNDCGIQIFDGTETDTIMKLTDDIKLEMRRQGKEYALSCSWENRATIWCNILFEPKINFDKNTIYNLHNNLQIPNDHIEYLKNMSKHFSPKVIYDIGSNVLHWSREAKLIWPNAEFMLFDGAQNVEFLYKEKNFNKYHIGILSDNDDREVKFYENFDMPGGNSYYREIGHSASKLLFSDNNCTVQPTKTLETVVKERSFDYPDLVKIDVQGSEIDIIKGGQNVIQHAKYLIVELQSVEYNEGAMLAPDSIKFIENLGWRLIDCFCNNGPDADYCFVNKKLL